MSLFPDYLRETNSGREDFLWTTVSEGFSLTLWQGRQSTFGRSAVMGTYVGLRLFTSWWSQKHGMRHEIRTLTV